jgi:hypothetical protein
MLRQRIEYRCYCNPAEEARYTDAIKAHGFGIVWDELVPLHDDTRPDGSVTGIRCEKTADVVFEVDDDVS